MPEKFTKIIFTTPGISPNDAQNIRAILEIEEVDYLHLRKPEATEAEIRAILEDIPEDQRGRVVLHDHICLVKEYDLGGAHLNSRSRELPPCGRISRSCHSVEEINRLPAGVYDYVTLSPIYPSISKPGYKSSLTIDEWKEQLKCLSDTAPEVIALGGVEPKQFEELQKAGFSGAALLGFIYNDEGKVIVDKLNRLKS